MTNNIEVAAERVDEIGFHTNLRSVSESTKDYGKVKIGGSCIRYTNAPLTAKDAGRVRIGGSCIHY